MDAPALLEGVLQVLLSSGSLWLIPFAGGKFSNVGHVYCVFVLSIELEC